MNLRIWRCELRRNDSRFVGRLSCSNRTLVLWCCTRPKVPERKASAEIDKGARTRIEPQTRFWEMRYKCIGIRNQGQLWRRKKFPIDKYLGLTNFNTEPHEISGGTLYRK